MIKPQGYFYNIVIAVSICETNSVTTSVNRYKEHRLLLYFAGESHKVAFFLYITNKMRGNLIKIRSCTIFTFSSYFQVNKCLAFPFSNYDWLTLRLNTVNWQEVSSSLTAYLVVSCSVGNCPVLPCHLILDMVCLVILAVDSSVGETFSDHFNHSNPLQYKQDTGADVW